VPDLVLDPIDQKLHKPPKSKGNVTQRWNTAFVEEAGIFTVLENYVWDAPANSLVKIATKTESELTVSLHKMACGTGLYFNTPRRLRFAGSGEPLFLHISLDDLGLKELPSGISQSLATFELIAVKKPVDGHITIKPLGELFEGRKLNSVTTHGKLVDGERKLTFTISPLSDVKSSARSNNTIFFVRVLYLGKRLYTPLFNIRRYAGAMSKVRSRQYAQE